MKAKGTARGRPRRRGLGEAETEPYQAVMQAAERQGLLDDKSSRISGRVSPALIAKAKKRTGIKGDSELIAYALAQLALEDEFAEAFKRARGKVDPDLKLDF